MLSGTQAAPQGLSSSKVESSQAQSSSLVDEESLDTTAETSSPDDHDQTPSDIPKDDKLSKWSKHTLRKRPWRRRVTDFAHIMGTKHRGSGNDGDPFIVQWLDNDQENPKNYSDTSKWTMTFLLAFITLCVSLASSAYTGAAGLIIPEFDCSREVFLLGLSFMVFGFALGPVVWAPLSEAVGRRNVLLVVLGLYVVFTGVCAGAQSITALVILRFFCGTFGSAAFVLPGGMISDMFEAEQRGVAQAVFAAAPFLGPTLGPSIGGFLSPAAGWRWLFGFLALYAGVLTFLGIIFVPETYAPVLLQRRAKLLSNVTGKLYLTKIDFEQPLVLKQVVKRSLSRPWVLLFREPIVLLLSVRLEDPSTLMNLLIPRSRFIWVSFTALYIFSSQLFRLSSRKVMAGTQEKKVSRF